MQTRLRNKRQRHAWLHVSRRCRDASASPAVELDRNQCRNQNKCLSGCLSFTLRWRCHNNCLCSSLQTTRRSVDHQPRTHQRLVQTCVLGCHSRGSASCHLELTSDHRMDQSSVLGSRPKLSGAFTLPKIFHLVANPLARLSQRAEALSLILFTVPNRQVMLPANETATEFLHGSHCFRLSQMWRAQQR